MSSISVGEIIDNSALIAFDGGYACFIVSYTLFLYFLLIPSRPNNELNLVCLYVATFTFPSYPKEDKGDLHVCQLPLFSMIFTQQNIMTQQIKELQIFFGAWT